jgi:benzoate membrane transport protein
MTLEKPFGSVPGLGTVLSDLSPTLIANAIVAFAFAASGPVAIILAVATEGGLSEAETASWIFGAFFVNGAITIAFCLLYRQPLVFFWTIPGTVLLAPALQNYSWPEVIAAFYATGALMLVLGLSGWVKRVMAAIPGPVVMGMVAGVFIAFALDWIAAFKDDLTMAAAMTTAFVLASAWPALGARVPPIIATLVVGAAVMALTGGFAPQGGIDWGLAAPVVYAPVLSWPAMAELVVPLAVTVLVVQNGQGFAILKARGHRAPVNAVTVACGLGSLVSALVGSVSTCLTGPSNALVASSGEKSGHYAAGALVGVLALAFGLLAPTFTSIMLATPPAFIATLAGLAMLRVLQNAFIVSFGGRFTFGALIAFAVTLSGVQVLNIGAPFWGLVFGYLAARIMEPHDFAAKAPSDD